MYGTDGDEGSKEPIDEMGDHNASCYITGIGK